MKICCTCKNQLDDTNFHKRKKSKDGLCPSCKKCCRIAVLESRDMVAHISYVKERIMSARRHVVKYLSEHPCVDCKEGDVVVLDFDHVRGVKEHHVTEMVNRGFSIENIDKEISKCEIRCSNCHRRRTARMNCNHWSHKI